MKGGINEALLLELAEKHGIVKGELNNDKFRKIAIKRLESLCVIKRTGRYFVKSAWDIDENRLRTALGSMGLKIEPEYHIDLNPSSTVNKMDFVNKIKCIVESTGAKFCINTFKAKVKSEDLNKALEEYFEIG